MWRPDALTRHLDDTRHIGAISAVTHKHARKHVDKHWLKIPRSSGWEKSGLRREVQKCSFWCFSIKVLTPKVNRTKLATRQSTSTASVYFYEMRGGFFLHRHKKERKKKRNKMS